MYLIDFIRQKPKIVNNGQPNPKYNDRRHVVKLVQLLFSI